MNLHTIRQKIVDSTREDWHKITGWGYGAGPLYRYGMGSEHSDQYGIQTEVRTHANIAILIDDVDISIAWGYDPDDSLWSGSRQKFDFSDFLPVFPDEHVSRMYVDVFYRGSLVDRELYVVADGGRYYVPIPRTTYPHRTGYGPNELGPPQHHYTPWDVGLAVVVNSFENGTAIEEVIGRIDYVLDQERPIFEENK